MRLFDWKLFQHYVDFSILKEENNNKNTCKSNYTSWGDNCNMCLKFNGILVIPTITEETFIHIFPELSVLVRFIVCFQRIRTAIHVREITRSVKQTYPYIFRPIWIHITSCKEGELGSSEDMRISNA
jgi:hypothetical protein